MKSSEPPRLATWLLEHFAFGNKNESLAGDLVEVFRRRRSVTWYWRQVFGAIIVSFSNELHGHAGVLGFAGVWTCVTAALWPHLWTSSQLQFLLGWGTKQNWLESLIYVTAIEIAAMAVALWVGLSLYLAVLRSFDPKRFLCGLLVGLLTIIVASVSRNILHFHYSTGILKLSHWDHYMDEWGPWLGALLLSMWTARPSLAPWNPNRIVA
jgi:hypothetical protein